MKKILKTFITTMGATGLLIMVLLLSIGYVEYNKAVGQMPIEEKIETIQAKKGYVHIEEMNQDFLNAIVAIEDHRFYKHDGIDYISIGRATFENIRAGKIVQGGSTLTQQLAKNIYFSSEQKLKRKMAELFVAHELEKECSKEEILELYANIVYFGDGNYGIGEASHGYFNKSPKALTTEEATLLAGLPQAPSKFALSKNYEGAKKRQKQVLQAMVVNGYLTPYLAQNAF